MPNAAMLAVGGGNKYVGSMTAGATGTFTGFLSGHGSVSPTTLLDGMTLALLTDESGTPRCDLRISGFGADPGASYLTTLIANGVAKSGASASYSYSAGAATWTWTGQTFGFVDTGTYPVIIA